MGELLIQIHEEMSELLDKQVNVQKESLKNFWGSCRHCQAHKKVCDENERMKNAERKKEKPFILPKSSGMLTKTSWVKKV